MLLYKFSYPNTWGPVVVEIPGLGDWELVNVQCHNWFRENIGAACISFSDVYNAEVVGYALLRFVMEHTDKFAFLSDIPTRAWPGVIRRFMNDFYQMYESLEWAQGADMEDILTFFPDYYRRCKQDILPVKTSVETATETCLQFKDELQADWLDNSGPECRTWSPMFEQHKDMERFSSVKVLCDWGVYHWPGFGVDSGRFTEDVEELTRMLHEYSLLHKFYPLRYKPVSLLAALDVIREKQIKRGYRTRMGNLEHTFQYYKEQPLSP